MPKMMKGKKSMGSVELSMLFLLCLVELHIRLRVGQQLVEGELLGEPVGLLFLQPYDRHAVV